MSDDLNVVVPEAVVVTVAGRDISIRQIRVGQLSKAMRIAQPFYERLKAAKDAAKGAPDQDAYGFDIYALVMENTDAILDMTSLLCGIEREVVDDLSLEDLVALFSAVVEVNLDFFIQRLLPLLSGLAASVNAAKSQTPVAVGQPLSQP